MTELNDLTGKTFGEWSVLRQVSSKGENSYWLCECSCGAKRKVRGSALSTGKSSKCKKCSNAENGRKNRKDDFHVASNTVLRTYKSNAKNRGIPFKLTREDVKKVMGQSCHYCGSPPSNVVTIFSGRRMPERAVSYSGIDRIDSSKGYTADNIVPCCFDCNFAKRDRTTEQFRAWVKRAYINMFRRHTEITPGQLVDLLFTTNYKCWWAQERLLDQNLSAEERADEARKAQEFNAKRTQLIRTIDFLLDFSESTNTDKTYADYKSKYTYFQEELKEIEGEEDE